MKPDTSQFHVGKPVGAPFWPTGFLFRGKIVVMKHRDFLGTYAQTDMKSTSRGKKPDYWVKAMDKRRPGKSSACKVGAAWRNEDGSISVDLNPFVTLETVSRSPEELVITLFPIDRTPVNSED